MASVSWLTFGWKIQLGGGDESIIKNVWQLSPFAQI
jgi:hypothetical protein